MKRLRAYQYGPESRDSGWDWFSDDDGRLWSVLDGKGDEHRHAASCGCPHYKKWAYMDDELRNACRDYRRVCCGLDVASWHGDNTDGICDMCAVAAEHGVCIGARIRKELHRLAAAYFDEYESRKPEIVAEILTIVTGGIRFAVREIHGCCQGEFAKLVYPVELMEQDAVDEIEARYFNTGDEWRVEDEDGNDICHPYTWGWSDSEQERQLREQIDGYVSSDYELDIYDFDGYEPRVPKFSKRKEVA